MRKILMFWVMVLSLSGQAFAGAPGKVIGATTADSMFAQGYLERKYTFIDIRPAAEFEKGHVPGANNLEFNEGFTLEALTAIVKKGDPVVFYGVGVQGDNNAKATKQALDWGYITVFYYRTGFAEWSTVGLPIEK
ncbi:MAG: rhodanese-like domain-containing protein [Endozoicomonadaceae bacterium]|nr:rhodanese-like domain-containing protein [Endozoicomonadaceae bacterium]